MSRVGKNPIQVPKDINVELKDNQIKVTGPKGELIYEINSGINVKMADNSIIVSRLNEDKKYKSLHGLIRNNISNMIEGVTSGFQKSLQVAGVGYKAAKSGKNLQINIGFSHPVIIEPPAGIELEVEGNSKITVKGIDKYLVGQIASNIRSIRPPEPYKGKGIKYEGEIIHKKVGKSGKATAAGA